MKHIIDTRSSCGSICAALRNAVQALTREAEAKKYVWQSSIRTLEALEDSIRIWKDAPTTNILVPTNLSLDLALLAQQRRTVNDLITASDNSDLVRMSKPTVSDLQGIQNMLDDIYDAVAPSDDEMITELAGKAREDLEALTSEELQARFHAMQRQQAPAGQLADWEDEA